MRVHIVFVMVLAALAGSANAQQPRQSGSTLEHPRLATAATKHVHAVRLDGWPVRLDGRLDDGAWSRAEWISDFTQREPVEGAPPSVRTEVAFLYDEDALYVGARMHGDGATPVRALVTRRDQESSSEELIVSLDTYRDRRTAYSFAVTAAGVRLDYYHATDREGQRDYSFEPVWQARTAIDGDGWTAELRIPFSQLRFNRCREDSASLAAVAWRDSTPKDGAADVASARVYRCGWGVNLTRRIPARNEDDYLVLVRRRETGWASRFAELDGIERERPSHRAELLPYVSSQAKLQGEVNPSDPFERHHTMIDRVGADVKLGLGPNLTLDATVNPDFAQVEADPAEVNLTAFKTTFAERRPFFVEGGQLLKGAGLNWFYSRRIGQAPQVDAPGDYSEQPTSTTILGAAKLTGRLSSGLSVGVLSAVTGPERARTYLSDTRAYDAAIVEPRTGYGVVRLQQELGESGSTLGMIFTSVNRDMAGEPSLRAVLPRSAYAGALDWNLRFGGRTYAFGGALGFSDVAGDAPAMVRVQESSAHYFQRPDARTVRLDSSRTSLAGSAVITSLSKFAGTWLWTFSGYAESPGLEINDAGKLDATDKWGFTENVSYRQTTPGNLLHRWRVGAQGFQEWNYDRVFQVNYAAAYSDLTWSNFWVTDISAGVSEPVLRADLTRGGPLMGRPRSWNVNAGLAGNPAHATRWKFYGSYSGDAAGGWQGTGGVQVAVRPGTRWELSADPSYTQGIGSRQYFTELPGGPAAAFGNRYIFAFIEHNELAAQLRLSYALTPDLTLETYAEPFASTGRYFDYGELPAARSFRLRAYGTDGTTLTRFGSDSIVVTDGGSRFLLWPADFRVLSFRSNVVLRWEWRAGSTAYLVWQQNRGGGNAIGGLVGPRALWDALSTNGDNLLAVKISYWLASR